ncbi:hypothetical protein BJY16_005197 [Actinoplanes octamycinicus]|uniref:Uncharacterized protein n=1 Tax=Actinoplanes octamycinicus TaxID=135948 RepID=A0A7W7M977_9ACTN|nr:hypothetical protein [Actinoplanes octamycinicus]MBB4741738.1 hypothetical protein [Actinoplanes octamycinicus]
MSVIEVRVRRRVLRRAGTTEGTVLLVGEGIAVAMPAARAASVGKAVVTAAGRVKFVPGGTPAGRLRVTCSRGRLTLDGRVKITAS